MTNKEYLDKVARLKEIDSLVRKPELSLDRIEELIAETGKLVGECYGYTRGLKERIETIQNER